MPISFAPPIRSRLQFGPGEGPEMYMPSRTQSLVSLSARFLFHHHDLCLFHQSIYRGIEERHESLESFVAEHKSQLDASYSIDELEAVAQSRLRETIHALDLENTGIRCFADQLLLVGLWSMVEQYCGQTLILAEGDICGAPRSAGAPHRWKDLKQRFALLGLDVRSCKSYAVIDECRIVNNKVKHQGEVDTQLASLAEFRPFAGKPLQNVAFPLQRYSDAVFEFVGHVLKATDEIIVRHTGSAR